MKPHKVRHSLSQMLADAVLPDDIQPSANPEFNSNNATAHVLLTGATGFLGRYVVKALLQKTNHHLICLVRANSAIQAEQRLFNILTTIGVNNTALSTRIHVICANLEQENFGLTATDYEALAQTIDYLYHCAALVNWARSYRKLRQVNVLGTLEVIRFACHQRTKPLLFVSSVAVCYATDRTATVSETTDMLPHIDHMPLGYAQSKCVAESLLQQAAQRGLPVTVLRPALISGATDSGFSSTEDFVAALLEGCVRTGMAMDEDWLLDFVPVDFVTEVITGLNLFNPMLTKKASILHLVADRPRYWRELILWLNLYGYPVSLLPPAQWLSRVFKNREHCGKRLYNYRHFFQGVPGQQKRQPTDRQALPYECYLQAGQQRIDSSTSLHTLQSLGLAMPVLDAALLQRYLRYFQQCGLLPKHPPRLNDFPDQNAIRQALQQPHAELQALPLNSDKGILNQIAAAYAGAAVGLRAYRVAGIKPGVVVKTKCADELVENGTLQMAALCSPKLGNLFIRFRTQLGLSGAQRREAALYELNNPALRRYTPKCFGTHHDQERGLMTIVLEKLPETPEIDNWSERQIQAVTEGLAYIQAVDHTALTGLLTPERSITTMLEMAPLWHELAQFAAGQCAAAMKLLPLQQQYIDSLMEWWPLLLKQPQGLVHGDFNPRNLILLPPESGPKQAGQLCIFDWELAGIGAPQRDFAEFLCFALRANTRNPAMVSALIERHRQRYAALSGKPITGADWQQGFTLALQQFVITRLPMYALMQHFRPQGFLPKLNENALWLLKCL